jgi:hypothetical protein
MSIRPPAFVKRYFTPAAIFAACLWLVAGGLAQSTAQAQQMKSTVLPFQKTASPSKSTATSQRYLHQLKASLQKGTSFAVFEPNGETLWGNVRRTMEDYLLTEWKSGKLMGTNQQQAFWVRCDSSTMTQNDLDNGRLIVLVGVAPVHPAEFVVLRITQQTTTGKPPRKRPGK